MLHWPFHQRFGTYTEEFAAPSSLLASRLRQEFEEKKSRNTSEVSMRLFHRSESYLLYWISTAFPKFFEEASFKKIYSKKNDHVHSRIFSCPCWSVGQNPLEWSLVHLGIPAPCSWPRWDVLLLDPTLELPGIVRRKWFLLISNRFLLTNQDISEKQINWGSFFRISCLPQSFLVNVWCSKLSNDPNLCGKQPPESTNLVPRQTPGSTRWGVLTPADARLASLTHIIASKMTHCSLSSISC